LAMGQVRLFEGLTDIERDILRSAATLKKCKKDEIIIKQGKPLERMFIILEGQAEIRVNGEVVATLPEGSLVGEVEFLDKLPASADVVVLRESTLIELNNAWLANLMEMHPRLGYVLMSEIARTEGQRLRAMDQK
ncbi:MAG: cyclic nucleotide-binding domain-containing protein, partial [Deltaproteobacteria bacterium]|nr:cyclic nucleotide-binding domain-containing protein [Deltaproteobacteria bacterium]